MMNTSDNKKRKKKKGPIRTGIITVLIIFGLGVFCYFKFLFDSHLKWGLETLLTKANYAEVNIADVRTSFLDGQGAIKGIQITNYDEPDFNALEVGEISFQVVWDALLRAKIVIQETKLAGIGFNLKRESRGAVYPKEKKAAEEESGISKELKAEKEKITEGNVLGDLATLLEGDGELKDNIKNINVELSSEKKIDEINNFIDQKKDEWKKEVKELKSLSELNKIVKKAKSIKLSKDPLKAVKQIKELDSLHKEAKGQIKEYKETINGLKSEYKELKNSVDSIDDLVKDDISVLKKRLDLPDVNVSEIGKEVFRRHLMNQIQPYMKYWHLVKDKIPQKNKDYKEEIKRHERSEGVTYHYPITKGYPFFWLKRFFLSSESNVSKKRQELAYQLEGEIKNVSSNQKLVGKPITFNFNGDIPSQKILGINIDGEVLEGPKLKIDGKVGSHSVTKLELSKSSKLGLALTDAKASTSFGGIIAGKNADLKSKTLFQGINWDIRSEKKKVSGILSSILSSMPSVDLRASFSGHYFAPKIRVSSNFDQKFKEGLSQYISGKLKETEKKLKNLVDTKILAEKQKLFSKLGKTEQEYLKPLLKSEGDMKNLDNVFDKMKKDFKKKNENKVKNKAKKELNKLKEKFKLPF